MIQIFLNLTSVLIIFFSSLGLIDSKLSEMNESVSLNNIPSLYPGLKWNNPTDTKYPIDYMDGNSPRGFEVEGIEWASEVKSNNHNYVKIIDPFLQYYTTELEKRKWESTFETGIYRINGFNADGVGSSWIGYIGYKNEEVRSIVIHAGVYPENTNQEPQTCPCIYRYSVFISNITDFPPP